MGAIRENREPIGNGVDGLEALKVVNAVYQAVKHGQTITM